MVGRINRELEYIKVDQQLKEALVNALTPITSRVRTDVTAIKAKGRQGWTNEPLTQARLQRHVNGADEARGCCPIKEGESVTMVGLYDLDSHKGEITWEGMAEHAARITDAAAMLGLEAIPFRSSGGNGIHLIFVWDTPQDAYSVRQAMRGVLESLGLRDGAGGLVKGEVEVFPKQDKVPVGGRGNQFILPLAGKSEPLLPLADYSPMGKEAAVGLAWPVSEPVPVVERPVREVPTISEDAVGLEVLRDAVRAIPNSGLDELDYDAWRDIVFGIHAETGGSEDGLALAHELSAKASKYDSEFLDNRVWPYIRDREGGISGRTVLAKAREYGWREDISHMFEVLAPAAYGDTGVTGEDIEEDLPSFQRNKSGEILATLENVIRGVNCFALTGLRIAYDLFKDEIMLTDQRDGADGWRPLKDVDYVTIRLRLEQRDFKPIGRELIRDVVLAVAMEHQFDSAILWASKLTWDGTPRVERFFIDYFGAADDEYSRAVSLYTWTAMAGRVLCPGIKADMSPTLISPQGYRKSTGIAAMAPSEDNFCEIDFGDDDDKNARKLRGVLIAESGEMKGFLKREQEHIKAFMSRCFEMWIPKYMERATRYPRRCLFIGSSNQEEFLVDETGNRRHLPLFVKVGDVDAITKDREQLWAEAIVVFNARGIVWQEAETLAKDKHAAHMIHDAWEHVIETWLAGDDDGVVRGDRPLRMAEIISGALGIFVANIDRRTEIRVGKVMRKLGFDKRDTWIDGKNAKMWHKA